MKNLKKISAIFLAVVMMMALAIPAMAAATADSGKGGPASITITLPTDNAGTDATITYSVYKVFDATNDGTSSAISYKINSTNGTLSSAMTTAGFSVDDAGNVSGPASLDADALAAIKDYAKVDIGDFNAKPSDGTLQITGLEYGYYYITTTTGAAVTVDSTNPNAAVNDKNTIPTVKKSAGTEYDENSLQAIAAVGTDQPFTAVITTGKGAENVVFTDTMTNMTYNGDLTVTVNNATVAAGATTYTVSSATGNAGFTVKFADAYIAGLAQDTDITLNYTGKITSDALSVSPAKNKATLTTGDENNPSSTSTPPEVEVYNAKFTVTKHDGQGKPLANAGFVIAKTGDVPNPDYDADAAAAGGTEYTVPETISGTLYYKLANGEISWVPDIAQATEHTSDANGAVPAFTGLADGTYTLIEKTVPDGYNKAADQNFTISGTDYTTTNLEQEATVVNNAGTELPSTGGMGTKILYTVGAVLVVGAGVVLVSKKRVEK